MIWLMMGRKNGKQSFIRSIHGMQLYQMRERVSQVYSGPGWKRQVEKMQDDQVIALYYKFLKEGKIK